MKSVVQNLSVGTAGTCPAYFTSKVTVHYHTYIIFFLVFYMTSTIVKYSKMISLVKSLFTSRFVVNYALYFDIQGPLHCCAQGPHMAKSGPGPICLHTIRYVEYRQLKCPCMA